MLPLSVRVILPARSSRRDVSASMGKRDDRSRTGGPRFRRAGGEFDRVAAPLFLGKFRWDL